MKIKRINETNFACEDNDSNYDISHLNFVHFLLFLAWIKKVDYMISLINKISQFPIRILTFLSLH